MATQTQPTSTPPAAPTRSAPRWRARARGLLPFVVTAASGFVIGYLIVYLFVFPTALVPSDRPVPNVVGLLDTDAQRALRDAGFVPQLGEQQANGSVPPNTVLKQTPVGTSMKPKGATVVIDVAVEP
ncbi:MAG: PASTA domain-containing protein [Gemmatirosa sp.]